MHKFLLLLKVQLKPVLAGERGAVNLAKERQPGGQMRKTLYDKGKPAAAGRGSRGYMPMLVASAIVMITLVVSFCVPIAELLAPLGQLYILPAITMTAASITVLITTIYKTNGLLFGFKDYDLVMSLPVKTSIVITSRLFMLYLMNFIFCLFIMVPSCIIYAVYASPSAGFYPLFILSLFFIPLIPIAIATAIGTLIAYAASFFKRKSGLSVVFTIAVMLVWMLVVMNMRTIVEKFADIGASITSTIYRVYPPTAWFANAVSDFDIPAFLLFIGVSVGAFVAFVAIVAKNFARINSAITANRTTSNYKIQELKQISPKKALFKKEFKRFTSSSSYLLNTGIGVILLTIASICMLLFGRDQVLAFMGMPGLSDMLANVLPIAMAFFLVIACTTSSSISLEGKSLWIIKSMPVSSRDILLSKLWVNLAIIIFAVAVNSTIFSIVFATTPLQVLMMYLTPLAYGVYVALFGLKLNLAYPDFSWDSEVKVVKQSMPTMVITFSGMAITIVPALLAFAFGEVIIYIVTAALVIISIFLYRNIMTKGVRIFDHLSA
ncbi:hypothetical protein LJC56_06585 [Christensenellaceae bacterium OttesenSCG-928-K19]|nr:hypothetical protein [Christensenellaceae bacterium OttesenSCG-928-K19]